MKRILILGSTGSIGLNALEIVRNFPDKFKVTGLTANCNIEILEKQITEFSISSAVVVNKLNANELQKKVGDKCEVLSGEESLLEIAKRGDYDILLTAIVGFAGLMPTIEAIKQGKRIALANKETLVVAGEIINQLCSEYKSEIIPVDSEHSAIFQCLKGENENDIHKLIITASGGPFFNKSKKELRDVTVEEALAHPNWKMGNKITIDSATMMNKGLEVIEAFWLFSLSKEKIDVLIHPQSIIHSMVEFKDGSIKAQLSSPDMKLPILYAFSYPDRLRFTQVQTDFKKIPKLTFFDIDFDKFECLKLAYDVISEGGTAQCILNAANEVAVNKFLTREIRFTDIPRMIKDALNKIENNKNVSLERIYECNRKTREYLNNKY